MLKSNLHVLIVDDSVVYRSQIRAALGSMGCHNTAVASNGRLGLERLKQTSVDLLILDLEMPEMDGLEMLKALKDQAFSGKILVFSSQSQRGAEITMEALRLGATDFVAKPAASEAQDPNITPAEKIRQLLEYKIMALFPSIEDEKIKTRKLEPKSNSNYPQVVWDLLKPKLVVIGASTGGPTVLENIFSQLTFNLSCPMVIVQHMPPVFTKTFAERLGKISGLSVKEAEHGDILEDNYVYVAPGNFHVSLVRVNEHVQISLDQSSQLHSVRPAVDKLFNTAAPLYKHHCLGIILTGMGADGKDGCIQIKKHGGAVAIQESSSCVVFGMPGAVYTEGAYDKILTPDQIIHLLKDKIMDSADMWPAEKKGPRSV